MRRASDPLDAVLAENSASPFAAVWRGYVAHSLLFYRQNRLRTLSELARIGGGRAPTAEDLGDAQGCGRATLRGLLEYERYWGSLRLSDASIGHFERAALLDESSVWPVFLSGMAHEMKRRYGPAIKLQERAMALRPDWSWPWILRGVCRWYMADFAGSVKDFEEAARLDPMSELPLLFSARAKADLRDRSLVRDLDRALKLAPRSGFVLSWRGRAMFVLRRNPEALKDLRRSIALLPDYDRGWSWLGVSYAERGRWAQAARLLRRARALNPYYPTTLYPLARCAMRLGRWTEGGRALREAAAIDRQGVWVEHRISMSHPNPACLRSILDLDRYLAERPRCAWALAWRGQTKLLLQDYREALADLNAALNLDPRDAWARAWRGETLRRLGCFEEALKDFGRARGIGWARAGAGFCLMRLGRPARALREIERSRKAQGDCAPLRAWRAEALFALGRPKAALSDWQAALVLQPNAHWIHERLWRAKARLGDWSGARETLISLSRNGGENSDRVWSALGEVETRLGRKREARAALVRARRLNPAAASADEASRALSAESMLDYCRRSQPKACLSALEAGDFSSALEAADKRVRDIQACVFRGWLALMAGRAAVAVEEASRALDFNLDPFCPEAIWLRSEAIKHAGL